MGTVRNLLLLCLLLVAFLILGAIGYSIIEDWTFLDSLYMTVITVATVGFREVGDLSPTGKYYTIGVILFGVGLVGITLSNFTAFLVSGKIRSLLRAGKMQRKISNLKNHFIICGCGRMGSVAVKELIAEGKEVIIVDKELERLEKFEVESVPILVGDVTDDDTLRQAGVERAKGLLAALPHDADNVFITLSARGINPALFIIARGEEDTSEPKLIRAGANRVVLPYQIGGRRMAIVLVKPEIVDFLDVITGKDELSMRLEMVEISAQSSLAGHSLQESNIRQKTGGALVMSLIRKSGDLISNPGSEIKILPGDRLLVLGHSDQIQRLEKMAS
ncbi:MAG: potassium channel protein [bacterium]